MIDLERARAATLGLDDGAPIPVSARWLKQAIIELQSGRSALHTIAFANMPALDIAPAPHSRGR